MSSLFDRARKLVGRVLFRSSDTNASSQDKFSKTAEAFLEFAHRCEMPSVDTDADPVGVVVMPWVMTAVPWYSCALAIGLARRGRNVVLIWDDTTFPARPDASARLAGQNRVIGEVLGRLCGYFPVVRLSQERARPPLEGDFRVLEHLVDLNLTWRFRAANLAKRLPPEMENRRGKHLSSLAHTLALVRDLLSKSTFDYLVAPGGIYSTSGLYLLAGREAQVKVVTYDAGFGSMLICRDGIAAQQSDIASSFKEVLRSDPEVRQATILAAQQEFQRRTRGKDKKRHQVIPSGSQERALSPDVLIPLNIEWDAAALGTHHIFSNTIAWLEETISFVLENSERNVVVRQHPAERHPHLRSHLDIGALLNERFGNRAAFRFVAAEEQVNTYDLIESASLVLPYVSTVGVESAATGAVVIAAGSSYYSGLGFVWFPQSREAYFDKLLQALHGDLPLLPQQCEKAWLCYYLSQVCNRVWTEFTPQPSDFWKWCRESPKALFSNPAVVDILAAIDGNQPLSLIRHRRNLIEGLI